MGLEASIGFHLGSFCEKAPPSKRIALLACPVRRGHQAAGRSHPHVLQDNKMETIEYHICYRKSGATSPYSSSICQQGNKGPLPDHAAAYPVTGGPGEYWAPRTVRPVGKIACWRRGNRPPLQTAGKARRPGQTIRPAIESPDAGEACRFGKR